MYICVFSVCVCRSCWATKWAWATEFSARLWPVTFECQLQNCARPIDILSGDRDRQIERERETERIYISSMQYGEEAMMKQRVITTVFYC